jgi:HD superfamily phosphodiesterase
MVKGSVSGVARKRETQKLTNEERQEKRKAILAALAKASDGSELFGTDAGLSSGAPQDYYTLSRDEIEALVNGDMAKIEAWVSNMDKNHAARLLHWLTKERW